MLQETEYQYILDGQQRTTSLLTSLYGGNIEGKNGFDPTLYVDLTIPIDSDTDDESYRNRFLFWDEIDDRNGELRYNTGKKIRFNEGLIVKLIDVKNAFGNVERKLIDHSNPDFKDYDHQVRIELRRIKEILDNYRVSFIEVKGIQISEVCQIFERINQAGKPLNIFDIVVAKTFKPITNGEPGFYLRELIDDFRNTNNSQFLQINDLDYLHALAVLINLGVDNSGVRNITDRYLNEIKTEHILEVWEDAKKALLKTFDFFENHLQLKTPHLIPFRYFYFTITAYFYQNQSPNYDFLKKYFWFYSFHNQELLSNTTHLFQHIGFLDIEKYKNEYKFDRFLINKETLRSASYSSRGRMSRALLSLFASMKPKDWEHCDREVLAHNLFFSTDKPNLHHIFPTNSEYILSNQHLNNISNNSLLNIAYLTQITNLDITNRNPLEYLRDYDNPEFHAIMPGHFLPSKIMQWARNNDMPTNALDIFVEERLTLILDNLKQKLSGITFEEFDTSVVAAEIVEAAIS
ncbi:GmrSD restriction endonuclease domain-containing protein [Niastella koreensis]|uniref:GmrSD restriction endonuclease domain-containing protein n=1 Tax=Niastella koreensis TaxID=354356 RepID=UPI0021D04DC9|nr:DUF262 domain-containing protein [Niastella koreensis]